MGLGPFTFHSRGLVEGAAIVFHCPQCRARGVMGVPFEQVEEVKFVAWIRVLTLRTTWIQCPNCGTPIQSVASLGELQGKSPDGIGAVLKHPNSPAFRPTRLGKHAARWALALALVPVLGLVLTAASIAANWGRAGWPKLLNALSLTVAIISTIVWLSIVTI